MLFLLLIIQLNHEYDHKTRLNILDFPLALNCVVSGIIPILDLNWIITYDIFEEE